MYLQKPFPRYRPLRGFQITAGVGSRLGLNLMRLFPIAQHLAYGHMHYLDLSKAYN